MEKADLKVGQTVWIYAPAMRHGQGAEIKEGEITKLGNKYFYAKRKERSEHDIAKFSYETHRQVCEFGNYLKEVYFSFEEWEALNKRNNQTSDIKKFFSSYGKLNLTNEQIDAIHKIIFPTSFSPP